MKRLSGLVVLLLLAGCGSGSDDGQFNFTDTSPDSGKTGGSGKDGGKGGSQTGPDGSIGGGQGDDDDTTGGGDDGGTVTPGDDSGGGGGKDSGPTGTTGGLATGLTITDIAIFQGSKVPLVKAGAAATPKYVPIVAGRQGLMRIYVSGSAGKPVTAELTLKSSAGTQVLTDPNRT